MKTQLDYYSEYLALTGQSQSYYMPATLANSILEHVTEDWFTFRMRQISQSQFWCVDTMCDNERNAQWFYTNRQLVVDWLNVVATKNGSDDTAHYANIHLAPLDYLKERTDVVERVLFNADTSHKNSTQIADYLCRVVATMFARGCMEYIAEETKNDIVWF